MKNLLLIATFVTMPFTARAKESDPIAKSHLQRAIHAAGGEGRLNTLKAPTMWMETGKYYGMGEGVSFIAQYASYWPNHWYRQHIEGKFAIGVAGDQVTLFRGDETTGQVVSGPSSDAVLHQSSVYLAGLLYPLLDDACILSSIPGVDIDESQTVGIKAVLPSGSEINLFFDKKTFLLSKIESKVVAPEYDAKLVKSETFFSDHKPFGGARLPSKYKTLYDGKLIVEGERTAIKVHATVDPAWFGVEGPARVR